MIFSGSGWAVELEVLSDEEALELLELLELLEALELPELLELLELLPAFPDGFDDAGCPPPPQLLKIPAADALSATVPVSFKKSRRFIFLMLLHLTKQFRPLS